MKSVIDFKYIVAKNCFPSTTKISVFGDPMHKEEAFLSKKLSDDGVDKFLEFEARNSIGNYVTLYQNEGDVTIITSPGYCGGYIYHRENKIVISTKFSNTLSEIYGDLEIDDYGFDYFISRSPKSCWNMLPFRTMFKDVSRLPSGSVVKVSGVNGTKEVCSYLTDLNEAYLPKNFSSAMNEISDSLEKYFFRKKVKKAALMFSGGVDCLVIYLALSRFLDKKDIRVLTMDCSHISRSNGIERAIPVSENLGFDIEVIDGDTMETDRTLSKISSFVKDDIIATASPHLALLDMDLKDTVIFHGQNMDALANISMVVLPESQELGYLSEAGLRNAHTDNRRTRHLNTFNKNLQFTDAYFNDIGFQKLTINYFADFYGQNIVPDPDFGIKGILRGLISSQIPNVIPSNLYSKSFLNGLDKELVTFESYIGIEANNRMKADMMRYLTYSNLAHKRTATFPVGDNSNINFIAMSGPLSSYFLGKKRDFSYASQPKREIYAYVRQQSSKPYRTLIKSSAKLKSGITESDIKPGISSKISSKMFEHLNPASSKVIKLITNDKLRNKTEKIYSDIYAELILRKEIPVWKQSLAVRLINLEVLLSNAQKYSKHKA